MSFMSRFPSSPSSDPPVFKRCWRNYLATLASYAPTTEKEIVQHGAVSVGSPYYPSCGAASSSRSLMPWRFLYVSLCHSGPSVISLTSVSLRTDFWDPITHFLVPHWPLRVSSHSCGWFLRPSAFATWTQSVRFRYFIICSYS